MTERWLPVPGWEGLYEVSCRGRVRSHDRYTRTKGGGRNRLQRGRILKQAPASNGRPSVSLSPPKRTTCVHQLVLSAFVPRPSPDMQVCHINGDPTDNRLENLRWGTAKDNADDRERHGRTHRGVSHYRAKFTPEDVRTIRSSGISSRKLAQMYGVSRGAIQGILSRRTWKHVEDA